MSHVSNRRSKRSHTSSVNHACEAVCEQLESRRLLATFAWTNRGVTTGTNDDRFDDVFGNLQNQARGVVDAALTMWGNTISTFNYGNGTNTYNISISMNSAAQGNGPGGVGANASYDATQLINGKPAVGTMGIGWRSGITPTANSAAGWFLDPTPTDSSEFQGAFNNAFSRAPTAPLGGVDLLTTVLHEIGHAVGLASNSTTQQNVNAYDTNTPDSVNSPASTPGSTLWGYHTNGALWTEWDSGGATGGPQNFNGPQHFAPLNTSAVVDGTTRYGAVALMNAVTNGGIRCFISDIEADCARFAWNYFINMPSSFGTMYNQLDANGTLRIDTTWLNNGSSTFTSPSNDVIDIRPNGSNLQVIVNAGNKTRGIDPLGVITTNFPISQVQRITIDTGDGDDFVRVFSNANNVPMTITGGDGQDTIEGHGATNAYDSFSLGFDSLTATGLNVVNQTRFERLRLWSEGGDSDLNIGGVWTGPVDFLGASTGETANLRRLQTDSPFVAFMSGGNDVVNVQVEPGANLVRSPVTINGGDGDDVVNVAPVDNVGTSLTQPVTFNGDNDNDTFVLGTNNADSIEANLVFNGGSSTGGNGNRIIINDQGANYGVSYDVAATVITRDGFFSPHTVTYSQTSRITINCGSGGDDVIVRNGVTPIIDALGNDGDDNFTRGDGIIQASSGANFNGGNGIDQLTFDDHLNANNIIWDCRQNQVIYGGIVIQLTTGFETVGVLAGTGANEITFAQPAGQSLTQNFNIDAGPGGDTFTLGFQGNATFAGHVNLQGADGSDSFNINNADTTGSGNVTINGGNSLNSLTINRPDTLYYTLGVGSMLLESLGTSMQFAYSNIGNGGITGNSLAETFYIYSASSANAAFSIAGNAGTDVFYAIPNDAGNFSFKNLVISGGADTDTFTYDATGTNSPGAYTFAASSLYIDRGSPSNQDNIIFGAGVENITLQGGNGNDSIRVDHYNASQYATGYNLRINGGNGNDLCSMGNGDFASNIISISALTFDGQGGTGDEMRIDNAAAPGGWTYTRNNGNVSFSNGTYVIGVGDVNDERVVVNAGASNDNFDINTAAAGARYIVNAGGGYDDMFAGRAVQPGSYVASIFGDIEYNAGAGFGRLRVWNNFGTGAHITHVDQNSIDAFPGDDLFGAGSVHFTGLANSSSGLTGLELLCGRGNDVVYAQPSPDTTVLVNAGGSVTGGNTINLALATAQNYQVTGTAANGSVTSSNLKPLNFTSFQNGPTIDAVAPAVAIANLTLAPGRGTGPQSLAVQFTEDVGAFINNSFLELTNLTSNTQVPASDIFLAYDPATFTATFTFNNYPGGLLPDGAYQARILGGLSDAFGNQMTVASNYYAFIWSAGTAGDDVFRVARSPSDQYVVYLNNESAPAFVAASSAAKILLASGAGNDAITLDMTSGVPIPSQGLTVNGGTDTDTINVRGSAGADIVTIGSININLGSTTETHSEVEAFTFNGAGDYDTLRVKGGAPTTILGTQHLAELQLTTNANVRVQPGSAGTLVTRKLSIATGCTLDLADNDMLVDTTGGANSLAQIQGWINAARNGGAWTGAGITSAAAAAANPRNTTLGAMSGADFRSVYGAGAPFNGQLLPTSAVLVKYTYYGDTDFNGLVNFDDYSRADAGFNQGRSGWLNGDFDGNGAVNFDDYSLIDLAFNTQSSTL